jgi:hypothetical protein
MIVIATAMLTVVAESTARDSFYNVGVPKFEKFTDLFLER